MPVQDSHHRSKDRRFSIIVVPSGDNSRSKFFRLAPWHAVVIGVSTVALVVGIFIASLIYTPLGALLNIPNPELEFRYSKELIAVHQRLESLMGELVELREYNVKLRNVLGENVAATDTGVVALSSPRRATERTSATRDVEKAESPSVAARSAASTFYPLTMAAPQRNGEHRVVFPAILPSDGYLSRGFNPAIRHFGLDIAGKVGTPVVAAADGYVVFAGWTHEEGYVVILSHGDGFLTFYKHNQSLLKGSNIFVRRGEPIALLGNTGLTSYGPHLHFEIWKDGSPVDPEIYLLNIKS